MKLSYLILLAACATQPVWANTVSIDFFDVEPTSSFAPVSIGLNDDISIECASGKIDKNLFLSDGSYMTVKASPGIAIEQIKFNFRPAETQEDEIFDYNVYKFDTQSNMESPDYNPCVIAPIGTISNPDLNSMIWTAAGMILSEVSFRNMRQNSSALSIETLEITYSPTQEQCAAGLPCSVEKIEFGSDGCFYGPRLAVSSLDGMEYTLCNSYGEGEYEVYLISGNDFASSETTTLIANGNGDLYNAVCVPDGQYTLAVKAIGEAHMEALTLTGVPATWPAGKPEISEVALSDKIWHHILVEFNFPTTAWNGKPLDTNDINFTRLVLNGAPAQNSLSTAEITQGKAVYGWTAPTGEWSLAGEWCYAYNVNRLPIPTIQGELTLDALIPEPGAEYLFDCSIEGEEYYNQFSTINSEKAIKGNIAGETFPFCAARPASMDYRYGWYIVFSDTNRLRVNEQTDCWLILPVLNLKKGKEYEVAFENDGITPEKEPLVAMLSVNDELSFDNMDQAPKGTTFEDAPDGTFSAIVKPDTSGSYFIGLRLSNNEGENAYATSATISRLTVKEKQPSAVERICGNKAAEGYFDIMGRRIDQPEKGSVVIKIADGKAEKLIVR